MEAIILAGGFGTRLKNVVSNLPKPMAPINGKPFLTYILDQLNNFGFKKVVLAVGYMSSAIHDYYGAQFKNMKIEYSFENEPLGTGGCVKKAIGMTSDQFVFVINGDTYFNIDFSKISIPNNILIVCKYMEDTYRYGRIKTKKGIVKQFCEKGENEAGYINGGIYYINRNLFDRFLLPEKFSIENDFFIKYIDSLFIETYISNDYFVDIGVPEDYVRAKNDLR